MTNRIERCLCTALKAFDNNQLFFAKKSLAITLGHQGNANLSPEYAAKLLKFLGWFKFYEHCFDEAREIFEEVLKLESASLGEFHPTVAHTTYLLAETNRREGNQTKAKVLYQNALKKIAQSLGTEHYCYKLVFADLAKLHSNPDNADNFTSSWHTDYQAPLVTSHA